MTAEGPEAIPLHSTPGRIARLLERLEEQVVGQRPLLERLVIALLAGGHVLIEGVPGLAKTRAVRAIAEALDLAFRRIPFTPDLLPSDLIGTFVYHPVTGEFQLRQGPIVTSVLLADEINRAPAKVQSALLEAMQDHQVTIGEQTIRLPDPFWVLATQNPIEHEGTYPLPEAELDRFLMKVVVPYPAREAELAMLDLPGVWAGTEPSRPPLLDAAGLRQLREAAAAVRVAPAVRAYLVDLIRATRRPSEVGLPLDSLIEVGGSPRATLALFRAAQAHALVVSQRDYVTPHDVKAIAPDVLRHRLVMSFEADAEGLTADEFLARLLTAVAVP